MWFAIYSSASGILYSEAEGPVRADAVADDAKLALRGLAFRGYAGKPVNGWNPATRDYDIVPTVVNSPEETQRLGLVAQAPASWTLTQVAQALTLILKSQRF